MSKRDSLQLVSLWFASATVRVCVLCRLLREEEAGGAGEANEGHPSPALGAPIPTLLSGIPRYRYHIPPGGRGGLCLRHRQCTRSTPHQVHLTPCLSTILCIPHNYISMPVCIHTMFMMDWDSWTEDSSLNRSHFPQVPLLHSNRTPHSLLPN